MINIKYTMEEGYVKIEMEGHALYAEHGEDIICAGVSTAVYSTILTLEHFAKQYPEHVRINKE